MAILGQLPRLAQNIGATLRSKGVLQQKATLSDLHGAIDVSMLRAFESDSVRGAHQALTAAHVAFTDKLGRRELYHPLNRAYRECLGEADRFELMEPYCEVLDEYLEQSAPVAGRWAARLFLDSAAAVTIPENRIELAPALGGRAAVSVNLAQFGVQYRSYQTSIFRQVVGHALSGVDRCYIRAPWQTGKTRMMGPLAHVFNESIYPRTRTVIVVPRLNILQDIVKDLEQFPGRVGEFYGKRKDDPLRHDVMVASASSLARHLHRFPPAQFGLVWYDEATFGLTETWQGICQHFGFLDEHKTHRHPGNRFLLGTTADPFNLEALFGRGGLVSAPSTRWFIQQGYLHSPFAVRRAFKPTDDIRVVIDDTEQRAAPRDPLVYAEAIMEQYRQEFASNEQVLIYAPSIEHAEAVHAAMITEHGEEHARVVHSRRSGVREQATEDFNRRSHPLRVLVSVGQLQYSFSARAEGVIFGYATTSLRRFGQLIARPLARHAHEERKRIKIVEVFPHTVDFGSVASLARLFGVLQEIGEGDEYDPLTFASAPGTPRPTTNRYLVKKSQGLFKWTNKPPRNPVHYLSPLMAPLYERLTNTFDGDIFRMAEAINVDLDRLDLLLAGEMPDNAQEVLAIERGLGVAANTYAIPWADSVVDVLAQLYPTPKIPDEFMQVVRRAVLLVDVQPEDALTSREVRRTLKGLVTKDRETVRYLRALIGRQGVAIHGRAAYIRAREILDRMYKDSHEDARIDWLMKLPYEDAYAGEGIDGVMPDAADARAAIAASWAGARTVVLPTDSRTTVHGDFYDLDEAFTESDARGAADLRADPPMNDKAMAETVRQVLYTLTPREEKVLRMRFGIGERGEYTLQEIGQDFFVTGKRIGQIEAKALRKMRHPSRARRLRAVHEGSVVQRNDVDPELLSAERTKFYRDVLLVLRGERPELPKAMGEQLRRTDALYRYSPEYELTRRITNLDKVETLEDRSVHQRMLLSLLNEPSALVRDVALAYATQLAKRDPSLVMAIAHRRIAKAYPDQKEMLSRIQRGDVDNVLIERYYAFLTMLPQGYYQLLESVHQERLASRGWMSLDQIYALATSEVIKPHEGRPWRDVKIVDELTNRIEAHLRATHPEAAEIFAALKTDHPPRNVRMRFTTLVTSRFPPETRRWLKLRYRKYMRYG